MTNDFDDAVDDKYYEDYSTTNELGDNTVYVVCPNRNDDNEKYSSYYNEYLDEMIDAGFALHQTKLLNRVMPTKCTYYSYDNDEDRNLWFSTWDIMEEGVVMGDSCSDDHSTHYKCDICGHKDVISNKNGVINIVQHGLQHYEEYKDLMAFI
jgi:hypothetical protein